MAIALSFDTVTNASCYKALNTPGGPVSEWVHERVRGIERTARRKSPINRVGNAKHRGGIVGTYKASWHSEATSSLGPFVTGTIYNTAGHADIVEFGRPDVFTMHKQVFTVATGLRTVVGRGARSGKRRTKWSPGAGYNWKAVSFTRGRDGYHVLENATNEQMVRRGFTPL